MTRLAVLVLFGFLVLIGSGPVSALAPPPEEAGQEDTEPTRILHSDREERLAALRAAHLPDEETCSNYATSVQLVIPVVSGERLFGYAFVTPRFCLARGVSELAVMSEMHFVVDNMVRAAHRNPMTIDGDLVVTREDTNRALLQAAREVLGESRVERLYLLGSDIRALN